MKESASNSSTATCSKSTLAFLAPRWDLDLGPPSPPTTSPLAGDHRGARQRRFLRQQAAFVVLLNFPLTTLEERLGATAIRWTRRRWAERAGAAL